MNFKAFLQENKRVHKTFCDLNNQYDPKKDVNHFWGLVEHVTKEVDEFVEATNAHDNDSAIDEFFDVIRMCHALLLENNISESEILKGYWKNREKLKKRGVLFG